MKISSLPNSYTGNRLGRVTESRELIERPYVTALDPNLPTLASHPCTRILSYDHQWHAIGTRRYCIPMDYHKYPDVEQIHLTCWKFVSWLEQLADDVKVNVALHIDGFHKMHVGRWMVLAIGTHCLQFYPRESTYRQSFRPLVLLLGKDEESIKQVSVLMLVYDLQSNIMIARRVAVSHEHHSLAGIEEAVQPFWDFVHRLQFLCESF